MENIKIKLLLKAIDGTISFIEFIQDGKSKILSFDNFIARYGAETIKELLSKDISPNKYKVNKATGIAFVTINKYYDDILEEVKNDY